jgi:uncharacterized protein YaaW (UPF0174 family)
MDAASFLEATDEDIVYTISEELRSVAGHSVANATRRSHDLPYKQILVDVANKLSPEILPKFNLSGSETELQIEEYINKRLQVLLEKHLKSMSVADMAELQAKLAAGLRAQGIPESVIVGSISAVATGAITGTILGSVVANLIWGSLWTSFVGMSAVKTALGSVIGGGPIGVLAGAAFTIAGTSYSKTIPTVARLIMIRLSHESETQL